ncbi:MAG: MBL fold metallo-hydrolase [Acidobacteria bacterium]|nr:MBL fold metallo-hydrolase [Acidobacteriota bacterium]
MAAPSHPAPPSARTSCYAQAMATHCERSDHGPVTFYEIERAVPGARPMRVGVYVVDGTLIDTGPRHARECVAGIIEEHDIDQVVLTHHHEDHIGNAAFVADRLGVIPLMHHSGQAATAAPKALPTYRKVIWGQPAGLETSTLDDEVSTRRFSFRVVHTPGHAHDHVVLHEPDQNWVFSGDLYLTDRVSRAFEYEDIGVMIQSMRTVLAIPDCELFCQHTGRHMSHQHQIGKKLDRMLGLRNRAIVHLEEGRSIREITRALGIADRAHKIVSRGEWSAEHLVRGLLRDAGRLD